MHTVRFLRAMSSRVLNIFKGADSKTFLDTFFIVSKCLGFSSFFPFPPSCIWLTFSCFHLGLLHAVLLLYISMEGKCLALSS